MAPSEGKKNGRRLLSFDTMSRSSPTGASQSRLLLLKPSTSAFQRIADDEEIKGELAGSCQEIWTGIDLSESLSASEVSSPIPERKQKPALLRSTTPDASIPASSSRKRWEQLRQHVLPVPIRSNTPPVTDSPPAALPTLPLTTRSQTPVQKPSRLARLGFRHVVEHAREADESRKISQEFERVCWSIRMAEPQKTKVDANTTGSSLHLTFMSHTSLASDGTSILERHPHAHKKPDLRRPQSVQSLTTYRNVQTVKPLYQLLLHHATSLSERRSTFLTLPHESLVLSTLLIPFLSAEESYRLEEERWKAIEAFEIIIRSWAPDNEGKCIERHLWCCKAATLPPGAMRTRILNILLGLITPMDHTYVISTPQCFQTLAQGLFSLLPHLRPSPNSSIDQEEVPFLMDVISKFSDGCCGELETHLVQEEYGAVSSAKDDKKLVREAILLEALSRCLEDCTNDSRVWLFQHVVEQYWLKSPTGTEFTPLLSAIYARALIGISRALFSILSVPLDQGASLQRAKHAAQLIQCRLILDMDALGDAVKIEARMNIIKAVLELVCMNGAREPAQWGLSLLHMWYRESSVWKSYLNSTLQNLISNGAWPKIIFNFATLVRLLSDDIRKSMVTFVLPLLYDRLVEGPPPFPCIPLTNLLDSIARLYPQIFYKPLFLCAASSKEFAIMNHLCVIIIISKFLPNFWIRDAEMMSVALMSDGVKKVPETELKIRTKQRLGQAIVMLELIAFIQSVRHEKEVASSPDSPSIETVEFVVALEARLAILLEAKEHTTSLAVSQRLLFCVLFREMRLLTRSLKSAPWLSRIVRWCMDTHTEDGSGSHPEEEQRSTTSQIQTLYAAAQDGVRSTIQRRSTMVLSKSMQKPQSTDDESSRTLADLMFVFAQREPLITSISKGFVRKAMKLLVTMSTLLTASEYRRLGPYLWDLLQDGGDATLTAAVCFLIMQCAEKTPMDLLAVIEVNLQSFDEDTKLNAVHKIGILFNWRYQIISQDIVADRARRPFKMVRGPLAFVSTDIGSTVYIREEDPDDIKDTLPAELRKRLAEIGWNHDSVPVDEHQEWVKVPMSLLSSQQLDRLENVGPDVAPPPSPTMLNLELLTSSREKVEGTGLLRRNTSTGGPSHRLKRRAVFVPSLTLVFPRLASLVFNSNLAISSAARSTMLDIMRNDPTLISRPVLDLFAGEQKDIQSAAATLNAFLHVQGVLPYPMSHLLFNNVAGFLKWASRQLEEADALQDFAHAVPILTRLVTQVSGLSVRDIRRAKIEPFLIPSGSLWFPSSMPPGPMFPRSLAPCSHRFENLQPDLVSITMIRMSQNMLLLAMLKRNRHDVQLVRKRMSRLELPTMTTIDQSPLELADFVPGKKEQGSPSLIGLSLMLSRSYVLLVAQVFRSMSRHLNDRNELAVLVDGLNRILLAHGDDIGIVSQVIIALMVASTRFRRLFTSGGGYVLFMPLLLKVYTESQGHPGIKLAIEYGVNRFYALHQESFVFQTLDISAHVTALPHIDVEPLVKSIYDLFFTLRKGVLPSTPDAAGIHNTNRVQEREALIMNTAEEKPQTFLTLLRRNQAIGDNQHLVFDLPEEYQTRRLGMEDFVRLFLTVIAHDPSIIRAEQFLRLLRILTAHLYHASSNARAILQGGIDALAILLMKTSVKLKTSESSESRHSPLSEKILESRLLEKSRSESNMMTMRLDFLAFITSFVRAGGLLSAVAMLRTTELIRTMLKEVPMDINHGISNFIPSFIRAAFMRESPPPLKVVVAFLEELAPLIANHHSVVDFSSTFHTISELVAKSSYSSQPQFSRAVVSCICTPALSSCEMAASSNTLMSLPSRLSIVTLTAQCIFLRGANVIAEVEKRAPSYHYLAGVVLPLVFSLKTEAEAALDRDGRLDTWNRDAIGNAWIRLLSFTMSTCRTTPYPLGRSRSQDRRRSNDIKRSPPSSLVALQIIKVIVARVGPEISSRIPDIWLRMRDLLVDILANGNARFATDNSDIDISAFPSPTHSPQSSVHLDPFQSSVSSNSLSALHTRFFAHPRIIDYSLWSFLEFSCVHRNPLVLQMRFFMMEKLVELDRDLRHQHHDPCGQRMPSSVFSKPRRHISGVPSPIPPGSSPLLSTSQSSPQYLYPTSFVSLEADRQPGHNILSSPHNIRSPKIIHLGPIAAFGRTLSPGRGEKGPTSVMTMTKSVALARTTYKRIRTVQKFMGCERLLPMPENQGVDGDDLITTTWTQKEVLDVIRREMEELLEEFEESDPSSEEGTALINPTMGPS